MADTSTSVRNRYLTPSAGVACHAIISPRITLTLAKGTLFKVLSAAVKPIELVGNFAAGAASAAFPPSQMCFGAAMYLIDAARGVSATLDAITELLSDLKNYTARLNVYVKGDLSDELKEKLAEILVSFCVLYLQNRDMHGNMTRSQCSIYSPDLLRWSKIAYLAE